MTQEILGLLYALPGILFALSVHEFSHGFVASKLGDPTAKNLGRLTLNPIKHIDLFGFIAMLVVHFGWAKPVPVNIRYFKKPRRDMARVALSGPLSNLISAFIGMILYLLVFKAIYYLNIEFFLTNAWFGIENIVINFIYLNIGLAVFNLIPVPPLDGSRLLDSFLPPKAFLAYHKYEHIISIVLLVVVISGFVSPYIQSAISFIFDNFQKVARFIVQI